VFGVSSQDPPYQRELASRLGVSYDILSDPSLMVGQELRLPAFVFGGARLYKRLVLVAEEDRIVKAFYPVFPSDRSAAEVLAWLSRHREAHA
jgi:peroxiredoxin